MILVPLVFMPFGVRTDEALLQLVVRVERTCWQIGFIERDTLRGLLNTHLVEQGIQILTGDLSVLVAIMHLRRRKGISLLKRTDTEAAARDCIIEADGISTVRLHSTYSRITR